MLQPRNNPQASLEALLTSINEAVTAKALPTTSLFNYDGKADNLGIVGNRKFIGRMFNKVVDFLESHQILTSAYTGANGNINTPMNAMAAEFGKIMTNGVGREALSSSMDSYTPGLMELVEVANIPANQQEAVLRNLACTLYNHLTGYINTDYWSTDTNSHKEPMGSVYPTGALADMIMDGNMAKPSFEMFGATMDLLASDIRLAMTVALLKPHKGLMGRFIHRRAVNGNLISYQIFQDELYDLTQTQATFSETRNGYHHRYNLVSLYRNPDPIQMTLKEIVPLKANDTKDVLVSDGVIKFKEKANLWDLATIPDVVGFNKINWTDVISDKVIINDVYFSVTKDGVTENYQVPVSIEPAAQFQQAQTNRNSAERVLNVKPRVPLFNEVLTAEGVKTEIFKDLVQSSAYILLELRLTGDIHLQEGNVFVSGTILSSIAQGSKQGVNTPVGDSVTELHESLKIELTGYTLDVRYSEENLRKIHMAVRSATNTVAYDLPQGKGIISEYSYQQNMPEHVMDICQEVMSLGIDHRNLQMITKTLKDNYNRKFLEMGDVNYRINSGDSGVERSYICSQRINPLVTVVDMDLSKVVSVRTGDWYGDIRQYVESFLTKLISEYHTYSLYLQQLDNNEAPTYKVIAPSAIIENLFSIPAYHTSMMPDNMSGEKLFKEKTPGDSPEYVRQLTSGIKLECISTTFKYMKDTILIVPYRPNDPESELNLGHNWDGGQFTVSYTPIEQNASWKRIYASRREWPIITNPSGFLINVQNFLNVHPTYDDKTIEYFEKALA